MYEVAIPTDKLHKIVRAVKCHSCPVWGSCMNPAESRTCEDQIMAWAFDGGEVKMTNREYMNTLSPHALANYIYDVVLGQVGNLATDSRKAIAKWLDEEYNAPPKDGFYRLEDGKMEYIGKDPTVGGKEEK